MDPKRSKQINRRFRGGFQLEAELDSYDVLASIAAGLAAALVDFLIVRIPDNMKYIGKYKQAGSPITKWFKSFQAPDDNWLAKHFKTSFDSMAVAKKIKGFGGRTHRLQTFGHDPLIGLVIGTIDIMRGEMTSISKFGKIRVFENLGNVHPYLALIIEIGHLLSDGATAMGIPPPGFSLGQILNIGKLGPKDRTIGELTRFMYLEGYDSRHFLTMSTSVVAAELVLRFYFGIRRKFDKNYNIKTKHIEHVSGAKNTSLHPTFQGMALIAHTIGAAANAGKVAIHQGNPLAINYAQWLRFLQSAIAFLQTKWRSPSDVIIGHAKANALELEEGWLDLGIESPDFPTLMVN